MKLLLENNKKIEQDLSKKFGREIRMFVNKYPVGVDKKGEHIYEYFLEIKFINKDILDNKEVVIYNYIKKKYKIKEILVLSKKFIDLHNVEKTEEFQKALEEIKPKIVPLQITKNRYWWIGLKNHTKDIDIENTIKEIYRVGMGMGLVISDFVKNE